MTQNTIGQRLKREMKQRNITSAELAKRAEVKTSFIYDVVSGKSANPSTVKLARVAHTLGISLSSLVAPAESYAGQGVTPAHSPVAIARINVRLVRNGNKTLVCEDEAELHYFRADWLSQRLAAKPNDLRMIYISGDSMEPSLYHNDLVMMDTSKKDCSPPGIFVLFDGVGLVTKRLEYLCNNKPPTIRIISDNAKYSPYERSADEMYIIGRVVWFAREI